MRSFTRAGLTFDVSDSGPDTGRAVVMLHGFPEDRHCWDRLTEHLVGAGCRVLAPDQRGYSPDARPIGRRPYKIGELCADVLALADTAGLGAFDVVGHDWGAAIAWALAGRFPGRIRSLVALSMPHPRAFAESLFRSDQARVPDVCDERQIERFPDFVRYSRAADGVRPACLEDLAP